jgi:hypothetical protein
MAAGFQIPIADGSGIKLIMRLAVAGIDVP